MNTPELAQGVRIVARRRMLTCSTYGFQSTPTPPVGRSNIEGWNDGMAKRLGMFIENFREDFRVMATLTYGATYPTTGPEVKRHLRSLWERLRRRGYLGTESCVWWLEFQERGAAHVHFLGTGWIEKGWLAEAWAEITGGDARACTRVEGLRKPERAGSYAMKYAMKSEQKDVPDGFDRPGRFWGCVGPRLKLIHPPAWERVRGPAGGRMRARCAREAAAMTGASKSRLLAAARAAMRAESTLRWYENLNGWSVYGPEREIRRLWHFLQDVGRYADHGVEPPECSRPETLAA